MSDPVLLTRYNYDEFVPEKFEPWMNFSASPPLGTPGPDFPVWDLEEREHQLSSIWSAQQYTIVEFGSFT
jgi:hypothetical protein